MRHDAYYWKCDCPLPAAERSVGYTAAKYDDLAVADAARVACEDTFGAPPETIAPLGCAGNHFAYRMTVAGRDVLFRAAADSTGDDYMRAEQALMTLAGAQGVPVPEIFAWSAEPGAALRWQLMALVPGKTMAELARSGRLDQHAIAVQTGQMLRRLHRVALDGFGFIDTARLHAGESPRGLHAHYLAYVNGHLDRHLVYVATHGLLTPAEANETKHLFTTLWPHCAPTQAVLVHRDPAWWNMIGSSDSIHALIDWDDAVAGDPTDDLAILRCFHDRAYTDTVEAAYWNNETTPADAECRIALHWLRNMLWKAMLRHQLGYFRPGAAAFLHALSGPEGLETSTRNKLQAALAAVRNAA